MRTLAGTVLGVAGAALIAAGCSREAPAGVLRRTEDDQGQQDEAFTRNLEWEYSWSLYSYERGNRDAKFYEITEDEASQIVEYPPHRRRRRVTGILAR